MVEDVKADKYPHLHHEQTRHGTRVWYVRRGHGPRIRIHGSFDSKEFVANYNAAIVDAAPDGTGTTDKAKRGTLKWLVDEWKKSSDWSGTKAATRKQRDNILVHVLEKAGNKPAKLVSEAHIKAGREAQKDRPAAANNYLKTMKALFRWAHEEKYVRNNPADKVTFLSKKTDGFPTWTPDDINKFQKRWEPGTRQWLALFVLLFTGLRRGDAVRVGYAHMHDDHISITTEKTGEVVTIPLLPPLLQALDIGPLGEQTFIAGMNGERRSKEGFGNWFRDACRAAGINKSAHGIRKLSATLFAEAGASEDDMMAWFGWSTMGMSRIYTKAASRKRQAGNAGRKLMAILNLPAPVFDFPAPKKSDININIIAKAKRNVVGPPEE